MIYQLIKNKYKILLALLIISLLSSVILTIKSPEEICDVREGCDLVLNSKYAKTLGIKNSNYGIVIFTILIIITLSQIKNPEKIKKTIIMSLLSIGSLIALYFLYLQQFVLKAYCKYCLVIDLGIITALIVITLPWKK